MNLINKKLLEQRIGQFSFPTGTKKEAVEKVISGWQKSLTESDLTKTKEKSVQGMFLERFFNIVLGYASSSEGLSEWNYIQHPKSEVDAQEADGSLGFFTAANKLTKAAIELKDAETPIDKKQQGREKGYTPVEQAYLYATKFDGCDWIIVSNFIEIRLYHKSRTQDFYESFNVLELGNLDEFKRFYFLLCKDNLIAKQGKSVVDELFIKTEQAEDEITAKFYANFKEARLHLLEHLSQENKQVDKTVLLEKAQKILDRMVFILFCEDTSYLLPNNIFRNTVERALGSFSTNDQRVWTELKGLFRAVDEGNSRVAPPINAYNGGLFKVDDLLDSLTIQDEAWQPLIRLAEYDFETEINVNILGHIFEQSISDLESLKRELQEDGTISQPSKRKKEGIYYTPQYITRYIVENTVGVYLDEHPSKLSSITILDPACGSGAFLNQAHSYLLERYTAEHQEKIKDKKVLSLLEDINPATTNRSILLNSLYGVDLNQESVEITKLSLWLKTARSDEPLENLDRNIKNGDSLIEDEAVAGSKAFNWKKEYKQILADGGFDVVIGNPPYIFARGKNFTDEQKKYYYSQYELTNYQLNTYILFIERALLLLKKGGWFGYIVPNTWLTIDSFAGVRQKLFEVAGSIKIVNIYDKVFADASVDSCLLVFKNEPNDEVELAEFRDGVLEPVGTYKKEFFNRGKSIINISLAKQKGLQSIFTKIEGKSKPLSDFATIKSGFVAYETGKGIPSQTDEMKKNRVYHSTKNEGQDWYKYLDGKDVKRYETDWSGLWVKYGKWLAAPRMPELYQNPRILIRQIPSQPPYTINGTFVDEVMLMNDRNSMIVYDFKDTIKSNYLLGVLNSRLTSFWFQHTFDKLQRKTFPQFKINELKTFPIPAAADSQSKHIASLVKAIVTEKQQLADKANVSLRILQKEYGIKPTNVIKHFYELEWDSFYDELIKQRAKLNLSQKEEVMAWFNGKQKELKTLQDAVKSTNQAIDKAVYGLYGLSNDEIALVEK